MNEYLIVETIPTGKLLVGDYSKGKLETLSIADYGKSKNIKADFLGYRNPLTGVANGPCKPLTEKWVITLSTQYGCAMKCTFCDVPSIQFRGNASFHDLRNQLRNAIEVFDGQITYTDRLNIHFARMGEPMFNEDVLLFAGWLSTPNAKRWIKNNLGLRVETIHPVFTTSLPAVLGDKIERRLLEWCQIKNEMYRGQAGLQLSINSTSEDQRSKMFAGRQLHLSKLSEMAKNFPEPIGRKYCLNFAYASDFKVDANVLRQLFDPENFMVKITPIHNNNACRDNGIETVHGYESFVPYEEVENNLIAAGFDVLIFVPSMDEENGLVTCGNAILGGSKMRLKDKTMNIEGMK